MRRFAQNVSRSLTIVACLSVLVCSSCSGDGNPDDDWPIDHADVRTDGSADAGTDSGPTRCPNAPTARFSAGLLDADPSLDDVQTGSIEVTPITDLSLNSGASLARAGHSIDRVEWKIEDRPEFALATFGFRRLRDVERPIFFESNDPAPTLQVGLVGDYTVSLKVWNEEGTVSCNTAELTVKVRPSSELYAEFKYPYTQMEGDSQNHSNYRKGPDQPSLSFYFKRTEDAKWVESINNVIPNTRGDTDVQDWGEPNVESDDPQYELIRGVHGNGYIQLDGVEESIVYEMATAFSGDVFQETHLTIRVFVKGSLQHKNSQVLGDKRDTSFGLEILRIQKNDGQFMIEPTSVVWYEN